MGSPTTPTKGREAGAGEPWTPTSNLKKLISGGDPLGGNPALNNDICLDDVAAELSESYVSSLTL